MQARVQQPASGLRSWVPTPPVQFVQFEARPAARLGTERLSIGHAPPQPFSCVFGHNRTAVLEGVKDTDPVPPYHPPQPFPHGTFEGSQCTRSVEEKCTAELSTHCHHVLALAS